MQHDVYFWHYIIFSIVLLLMGAVGHVCRAVFNVLPDRITDKPQLDIFISGDYSLSDYLFGLEFDDAGYYRLDSTKNLCFCCVCALLAGLTLLLLSPDADRYLAYWLDFQRDRLIDLFWYRVENVRWF